MSTPSQPPQPGKAAVRVAYDREEAAAWKGRSVVVDLFRFSATVCALLQSGRNSLKIYGSPELAVASRRLEKGSDLFSEIDLGPSVEKYDNSPYTALLGSDPSRPAFIVTNSGGPAVMGQQNAAEVLIGCFANAPALAAYCSARPMDTLMVPACLYYDRKHVEDFICCRSIADALGGADTFAAALEEIHASARVLDFLAFRPETGRRDMDLILRRGTSPVVPRVRMRGVFGEAEDALGKV